MLAKFDIGGPAVNHIRTALYLLLFALWGFSLDRRIIQRQTLHCLRLTAALMLLWLILRTLKYSFVTGPAAGRYIWYLYYLPMLFLPLLGVYIALSMGKSEDYRLSREIGMLSLVPAALRLLWIPNDLHQQIFAFKSGVPGLPVSGTYSYRPLYFICLGWMVVCMAFSLVCLFRKSRIPSGEGKRITPFVLGCAMLLYGILYLSGIPAVRWWFGDMNVMFCLLYAAIYESCIRCRMIPSNTGYVVLFEASTLAACIADQQDRNTKTPTDASLVRKSLPELTEKNRLYNELEAKHSRQTAQMRQMLARCESAGPAERRSLLKKVLLLGTYIKRSANLYFLSSEYRWLPQQELRLTVDEAVRALTACGT